MERSCSFQGVANDQHYRAIWPATHQTLVVLLKPLTALPTRRTNQTPLVLSQQFGPAVASTCLQQQRFAAVLKFAEFTP